MNIDDIQEIPGKDLVYCKRLNHTFLPDSGP